MGLFSMLTGDNLTRINSGAILRQVWPDWIANAHLAFDNSSDKNWILIRSLSIKNESPLWKSGLSLGQTSHMRYVSLSISGEGGIRTREPLWVTRFPSVRAKPDYATSPFSADKLYHVWLFGNILIGLNFKFPKGDHCALSAQRKPRLNPAESGSCRKRLKVVISLELAS